MSGTTDTGTSAAPALAPQGAQLEVPQPVAAWASASPRDMDSAEAGEPFYPRREVLEPFLWLRTYVRPQARIGRGGVTFRDSPRRGGLLSEFQTFE